MIAGRSRTDGLVDSPTESPGDTRKLARSTPLVLSVQSPEGATAVEFRFSTRVRQGFETLVRAYRLHDALPVAPDHGMGAVATGRGDASALTRIRGRG